LIKTADVRPKVRLHFPVDWGDELSGIGWNSPKLTGSNRTGSIKISIGVAIEDFDPYFERFNG